MCWLRFLLLVAVAGNLLTCQVTAPDAATQTKRFQADSLAQLALIKAGNAIYAQKQGYASFAASLAYYDSAQLIANRWQNPRMQALAVYARARVYDAWNKDPQLTIDLYRQTVALYQSMPAERPLYLYTKHLLAHAYDKVQDTTRTVAVLTQLYNELNREDTVQLRQSQFTAEMALIATQVGAYPLAGKILANLTRRAWISNDPNTYDYLNHYYLTRSRIDVFYRHRPSPYIDSLEQVFRRSRNLMDSLYYAENLGVLLGKNRDYSNAYRYWQIERQLTQRLNHAGALVQMQHALLNSELLAEKNKLAYQTAMRETRWQAVWVMGALLIIITWLSAYLYRRNRQFKAQSDRLAVLNQQLDEQVDQVQLLNKEIQHRVKNNLQMIYSLLHMQERKTANPDVLAQLQQARLRVESIATLHNQLIETNGPIDLTLYINSMIDSVVRCYDKVVTTQLDFGPLLLPANYYLPLALILTEWVTNSLKHAVPAGDELCIQIKLQSDPGKLCVAYADNGLVVSASPVPNLGMDIVRLLSRQISGVLTSPPDNPYRYQLCLAHD